MSNAAEKFTQTVRLCASQFVQPCTAHCNVFLIEPLAKPTDAQLFTRQSSAKQTQANSPQAYKQLLKRYKPDRPYRQTHFAPSLDSRSLIIFSSTELQQRIQDTYKIRQKVSNNYITPGTCHCRTRYASKFE